MSRFHTSTFVPILINFGTELDKTIRVRFRFLRKTCYYYYILPTLNNNKVPTKKNNKRNTEIIRHVHNVIIMQNHTWIHGDQKSSPKLISKVTMENDLI